MFVCLLAVFATALTAVYQYRVNHQTELVAGFKDLLSIPNVAADLVFAVMPKR
jgi:hypothetical protein